MDATRQNLKWVAAFCAILLALFALDARLAEALARNNGFLGLTRLVTQEQITPSASELEPILAAFQGAGVKQSLGQGLTAMFSGNCRPAVPRTGKHHLHNRPGEPLAAYWLGRCYSEDGDWQSAIQVWEEARLARPLQDGGDLLASHQDWQLAAAAYHAALTLNPNDCVYQARAVSAAWWMNRDTATATSQIERIVTFCPHDVEAYLTIGRILIEDQQFDRAEVWLIKARDLAADSDRPWTTLALLRLRQNRAREALPLLETAIRIDPSRPSTFVLLGSTYTALGQAVQAVIAYETAIRMGTSEAWVYEVLGLMYEKSSDKAKARVAYRRALELDPDRQIARTRLAKLGELQ